MLGSFSSSSTALCQCPLLVPPHVPATSCPQDGARPSDASRHTCSLPLSPRHRLNASCSSPLAYVSDPLSPLNISLQTQLPAQTPPGLPMGVSHGSCQASVPTPACPKAWTISVSGNCLLPVRRSNLSVTLTPLPFSSLVATHPVTPFSGSNQTMHVSLHSYSPQALLPAARSPPPHCFPVSQTASFRFPAVCALLRAIFPRLAAWQLPARASALLLSLSITPTSPVSAAVGWLGFLCVAQRGGAVLTGILPCDM